MKFKVQLNLIYHRREDSMDVEIAASGFTKEMDEDLNVMLLGDQKEGDEDDDETEDNSKVEEEIAESSPETEDDAKPSSFNKSNAPEDIEALQQQVSSALAELKVEEITNEEKNNEDDRVGELKVKERKQRLDSCTESIGGFSMVSRSTAATIAPEVIRDKIKKTFQKSDKMQNRRRIQAKGEASASTRARRENRDNIKQNQGIWGWE